MKHNPHTDIQRLFTQLKQTILSYCNSHQPHQYHAMKGRYEIQWELHIFLFIFMSFGCTFGQTNPPPWSNRALIELQSIGIVQTWYFSQSPSAQPSTSSIDDSKFENVFESVDLSIGPTKVHPQSNWASFETRDSALFWAFPVPANGFHHPTGVFHSFPTHTPEFILIITT